jgi:hypothetical protein
VKATLGNDSRCWDNEWNDDGKNAELSSTDEDIQSPPMTIGFPAYFGTLKLRLDRLGEVTALLGRSFAVWMFLAHWDIHDLALIYLATFDL